MIRSLIATAIVMLASVHAALADDAPAAPPIDQFAKKSSWQVPAVAEVRKSALEWLATRQLDEATRTKVAALWPENENKPGENKPGQEKLGGEELLDRLAETFASGDPEAKELVTACAQSRRSVAAPTFEWLADEKLPALERYNLRLLFGRWLAQNRLYDEAAAQLADLKTEDVVDPASLLFYQAVVHQRMLKKDAGLQSIMQLLERPDEVPKRYAAVAKLMQADLTPLKDDSLDHISRRMDDIRRRLDLGRAGPKVREVEDGVIASLDKLIEEIEKAQAAAAAAAAAAAGRKDNIRASNPAQDSVPIGGKGPGNVTQKNIGNKAGWGNLPPKEREEALQQIGKDFPTHYRDVIEQYFRKLATENSQK